jgi:hypothetical protein
MLRRVALVRTDVSEELSASSFFRVTRIGKLGTTLALTSNRRTLRRNIEYPPKRRFLQDPHGVISQKTPFFIVTAVNTSNLIQCSYCQPSLKCSDKILIHWSKWALVQRCLLGGIYYGEQQARLPMWKGRLDHPLRPLNAILAFDCRNLGQ